MINQILPTFTKAYTVKGTRLTGKITGTVIIACAFDEDGDIIVYPPKYPYGLRPGVFGGDGEKDHLIPIIRERDMIPDPDIDRHIEWSDYILRKG